MPHAGGTRNVGLDGVGDAGIASGRLGGVGQESGLVGVE